MERINRIGKKSARETAKGESFGVSHAREI